MLLEDTTYYFIHKFSHHNPFVYKHIHKLHHESIINVSIAAEYTTSIDLIILSLTSYSIGPSLLGKNIHFLTFMIYVTMRTLEGFDSHCGYDFPWCPVRLLPLTSNINNLSFFLS